MDLSQRTSDRLTAAARDVLAERRRQIAQERFSLAHDDRHRRGTLTHAAMCYAEDTTWDKGCAPPEWPFEAAWWKPTTRRRNLVKATALLLAEIEREDRRIAKRKAKAKGARHARR